MNQDPTRRLVAGAALAAILGAGASAPAAAESTSPAPSSTDGPYTTPEAHGAVRDGVSNDTSAIQAALAAAGASTNGTTVLLSGGTYLVDAGLTIASGVHVIGQGSRTILKASGGGNADFILGAIHTSGVVIRDLSIDGGGTDKSGIRLDGATEARVEDVSVADLTGIAVRVEGACAHPRIRGLVATGTGIAVLVNGGSTDAVVSQIHAVRQTATENYVGAVYVPNAVRSTLTEVVVESSAVHGAFVGADAIDTTFIGCTFRGNGTTGHDHRGASVIGARSTSFIGCRFTGNAEAGLYVGADSTDTRVTNCAAVGNNTGDRPGGHGIELLSSGAISASTAVDQNGSAPNAGCGIYIGGTGGVVTGCYVAHNYSAGIRLCDTTGPVITGNHVKNNSQRGRGLSDGIEILGTRPGGVTDVVVTSNRCFDDQSMPSQRFGIAVLNGYVDWYSITGNSTRGNALGGGTDSGGSNKTIANNVGL